MKIREKNADFNPDKKDDSTSRTAFLGAVPFVRRNPILLGALVSQTTYILFVSVFHATSILYLVDDLEMSPGIVGACSQFPASACWGGSCDDQTNHTIRYREGHYDLTNYHRVWGLDYSTRGRPTCGGNYYVGCGIYCRYCCVSGVFDWPGQLATNYHSSASPWEGDLTRHLNLKDCPACRRTSWRSSG
jgi:hypothetical protein